jgi:phosphomannomutase
MKVVNAVIGGEGNGGIIYPELHYGRDALVGIALFLSHLAKQNKTVKELRASYPDYHISKNKIELTPQTNVDRVLDAVRDKFRHQPVNTDDGVKIEFDNDWVHLRKSNTEPIIRIYAESRSAAAADKLAKRVMDEIAALSDA